MRRRLAWVAGLVPLLLVGGPARAQSTPSDASGVPAGVAQLIVVGGGHGVAELLDTVRDRLDRVGLVIEAHAVATPADAALLPRGATAARVRVDLRFPDETLILSEGRQQAPKQRTVRRDPSPNVAREELAEAIESAVESQLFTDPLKPKGAPASDAPAGPDASPSPGLGAAAAPQVSPAEAPEHRPPAPIELARETAHETAREVPGTSATSSSLGVDVSMVAGGGWFANAAGPVVALGGDVTLASRRGLRPSIALAARSVLPFDGTADTVTCHASALAIRVLAGIELMRASWIALEAGAGGGTDVLWAEPRSGVLAPSVLGPSSTRADPIVSALVAAHVALVTGVSLTVAILGDLDLAPTRYVVVAGTAVEPVLSPWTVRPTFLAGLTFTALGQPAFASAVGR
jgi:hypothetical protein